MVCPPCLPLSPLVSHCPHVCLCWMVCTPSRGLVFPSLLYAIIYCIATGVLVIVLLCLCLGWFCRPSPGSLPLCPSLFPFVAGGFISIFPQTVSNSVLLLVVNAFSCISSCYSQDFCSSGIHLFGAYSGVMQYLLRHAGNMVGWYKGFCCRASSEARGECE